MNQDERNVCGEICEKTLLRLLVKYHHYKFMSAGFLKFSKNDKGMNLYDFMEWLHAREPMDI